ncbi:unnamed protein product, partial [Amoebophrya sp. A25]
SPVFCADRKGHLTKRMVVDYRAVNKNFKSIAFRMPDALQIFKNLEGGYYFGACDLAMGYNQVELSERMQRLLTVVGPDGCYYPTRLPLGPSPAPAFFQQQTASAFEDVVDGVFIDDLIYKGKDFDEFLRRSKELFDRCEATGFTLSLKKSVFGKKTVEVLGFNISQAGRTPTPKKVEQLRNWPKLESKDDLVSLLAFANYLREFIPNYQRIRGPLAPYTKKRGKPWSDFSGDVEAQDALTQLKRGIADDVPLTSIDFEAAHNWRKTGRPVVVTCDASRYGRSYVICQAARAGGPLRPCVIKGVSFDEHQQGWSVLEQELSAVKLFCEDGWKYVDGLEIFLLFDHENLDRVDDLVGNQRVRDKILRWLEVVRQ